jgi:hypothetical protein
MPAHKLRAGGTVSVHVIALLVMAMLAAMPLHAQEQVSAEYRIKAAFLYHFCNYVNWPEDAFADESAPLVIGVAAPERIVEQMRMEIEGRDARGRPIVLRAIQPAESLKSLHAIYLTRTMGGSQFDLTETAPHPVLIVTESDHGLKTGSIINFVIEQDRVRFDIAPDAARQRSLNIGAQLLTVARRIEGKRN